MAFIAAGTQVKVVFNGKSQRCTCLRVYTKSMKVDTGKTHVNVPLSSVQLYKKKSLGKRKYVPRSDHVVRTQRSGRHRKVDIMPVKYDPYNPSKVWGNFNLMSRLDNYLKTGIFVFNDNLPQFQEHICYPTRPQYAGGGTAGVRPLQHLGHAFGFSTGPHKSITEKCNFQTSLTEPAREMMVTELIDFNAKHIARQVLKNPEKDTLYYSVDSNDPEGRKIGLGIFAGLVGSDVVEEITNKLHSIPKMVQHARMTGTDI